MSARGRGETLWEVVCTFVCVCVCEGKREMAVDENDAFLQNAE